MTKLLKYFLFFITPLLLVAMCLFLIPYNRKFAYLNKNNEDCNTTWIYYRLFENNSPIQTAFIGTSHTGCGINDKLIQSILNTNIVNLAYCGGGRNIDYPIIKDLIETKKPKTVIIEIKNQNDLVHKDYALMANSFDLFFPPQIPANYLTNIYDGFKTRLNQFRNNNFYGPVFENNTTDTIGNVLLNNDNQYIYPHKKYRKVIFTKNKLGDNSFFEVFKDSMTEQKANEYLSAKQEIRFNDINTLKQIVDFLNKNNVQVRFIYIPSFGNYFKTSLQNSAYAKLAPIIYPPENLFNNRAFWIDHEHLNANGANQLSKWLAHDGLH